MTIRVIIAGGRDFNNYELLKEKIDYYLKSIKNKGYEIIIICGGANGADSLGERYAIENKYEIEYHPADWNKYGRSAGYKRNLQMGDVSDVLIAFWDKKSKGTKYMIDIAKEKNLITRIVYY